MFGSASRLAQIAGAVIALSLVGCAAEATPNRCPAYSGLEWREMRSRNFILRTNIERAAAAESLGDYETIFDALHTVGFPGSLNDTRPITVVLLKDESAMRALAPIGVSGLFYARVPSDITSEPEPTVVLPAYEGAYGRLVFAHELTHAFVHRIYPSAPTWLNEGLAQYFSTLRLTEGSVILGALLPGLPLLSFRTPPAQAIMGVDSVTFYGGRGPQAGPFEGSVEQSAYYTGAFWLVHMLMNGPDDYRARFHAVLNEMRNGNDFNGAWERWLGGDDSVNLEPDFRAYVRSEQKRLLGTSASVSRARGSAFPERIMADAEVYLLRARLMPWTKGTLACVKADLDSAWERAPASSAVARARALYFVAIGRYNEAIRILDSVLAQHPDDIHVKMLLEMVQSESSRSDELTRGSSM